MKLNFLLQSLVQINNLEIFTSYLPSSLPQWMMWFSKIRTGKLLHIPTNKSKNNCPKQLDAGFEPEKFTHCLTFCILMDSSFQFDTIKMG